MRVVRLASLTLVMELFLLAAAGAAMRDDIEHAVHDATVLVGRDCAGVIAERPDLVFTAEHCVRDRAWVELTLANGALATGWVVVADRLADQALLVLEAPAPVMPLLLARRRSFAGTVLYFAGNPRAWRFREVTLKRVGRWPSLPLLQSALFTTIAGSPADAGAPLVNTAGRVVGVVHGGRHFEVGTPAYTLRRLMSRLLGDGPLPPSASADPGPDAAP
jgi:S1-C subfamily serine protease